MKMLNKLVVSAIALLLAHSAHASSGLEEYFFASGKIKVVIAVVGVVLIGLFVFLFRLERRLQRLEKNKKS